MAQKVTQKVTQKVYKGGGWGVHEGTHHPTNLCDIHLLCDIQWHDDEQVLVHKVSGAV